jgi:uncharacterized protein (TIGR03792 family)
MHEPASSLPPYTNSVATFYSCEQSDCMVIESLQFQVDPDYREQFIQLDEQIWTPVLANSPGFLGKEVWISPDDLSEVVIVVRWASFEEWQAIPEATLNETEAAFLSAMGETYTLMESKRFQVRKFSQVS